jgi:dipeptidyl aminopeptidase/acylaminoacyl peptidase
VRRIAGEWGPVGEQDHLAAVEHVVAEGMVDPARIGVLGHSHGGYAACWLAGRYRRFAAAVAEDPVVSLHTVYRASDIGAWGFGREFGVGPADLGRLSELSPIHYAHQCSTPLLLMQGEQDLRTLPVESEQMYAALWEAGCEVEMLRFPRADHMGTLSGSYGYRRARIDAVVEWFTRHMPA